MPVKKPDDSYCLANDLRAVNEVNAEFPADAPDPPTLLAQIPPKATHFTVLDLCGAFLCIPLNVESQGLFGFTHQRQFYHYQRLPMGYKHSPHVFNKVLKEDFEGIGQILNSTVIQYGDDIIICSPDRETCHEDSNYCRFWHNFWNLGYLVTTVTHYSLRIILTHGKYAFTMSRLRDYHSFLEQEDVTLVRCTTRGGNRNSIGIVRLRRYRFFSTILSFPSLHEEILCCGTFASHSL